MNAVEVRFDKPVMADALHDLEELLGDAEFHDSCAALFSTRSLSLEGQAVKRVCNRVRSTLEIITHHNNDVVELDDATAYRALDGRWRQIRPS